MQLFISSPAAPPRRQVRERQQTQFGLLLNVTGCTTLKCLRSLPEKAMLAASDRLINQMESTGGGGVLGPILGYGPAPDGGIIPDLPLVMLREGRFHDELEGLVLGSMALEGMTTSHDTDQPGYFPIMVRQILPQASDEVVAAIQALYYRPEAPAQLAWDWTTDAIFSCNAYNLANALPAKSRRYVMSTPPAIHGQDMWCMLFGIVFPCPPYSGHPCSRLMTVVHGRFLLRRRGANAAGRRSGPGSRVSDQAA
jgi:carboxylesterase type B